MKKYLQILLIPFAAFAETCEELKTQAMSNITSSESLLSDNARYIQITYQNITSLGYTLDTLDQRTSGDPYVNTARSQVSAILQGVQLVEQNENTISNDLFTARSLLSSIDCSCDETSTCPCDFSDIIQLLTSISSATSDIYIELQSHGVYLSQIDASISQIEESIAQITTILDTGFGNITNLLSYLRLDNLQYSSFNPSSGLNSLYGLRTLSSGTKFSVNQLSLNLLSANPRDNGWFPALWSQGFDTLKILGSLNSFELNKYSNVYRPLTNSLITIVKNIVPLTDSTTNFFSFFRGEIGVQGVLEDWQSEEVSGTYYDFLTNHYLSVVFGDSLSGYQAEKTNWFSRIETLLAALVFVDGSETNAYLSASEASSNSVSNAKNSFNSVFDGVSSAPSTQMELAVDIEKSMYNSLKSFSQAFSSASLPSTVRLLYVYKDGGGGGSLRKGALRSSGGSVDVSVDVDGKLSDFIEILRSCSTLCWVFFGLWFMFKFTVWTVKKIYLLIRYIIDFFNMVAGGK